MYQEEALLVYRAGSLAHLRVFQEEGQLVCQEEALPVCKAGWFPDVLVLQGQVLLVCKAASHLPGLLVSLAAQHQCQESWALPQVKALVLLEWTASHAVPDLVLWGQIA